jgi:PAS domain S-box-containing protein
MRPRLITLRPLSRYGSAIAIIAVAAALRFTLNPVWGVGLPYITFYPAVMLSAWLGGIGPGLVATALAALIADYFWVSPPFSLSIRETPDTLGLLVFIAMGIVISVINEAWRRSARNAFESQQRLAVTLTSIGDGVIATDASGRITRMNPVAQALVGWTEADAIGRPVSDVFVIVNEETRQPAASPVDCVLEQGVIAGLANHTILIARDGREIPIDDSAAPIKAENGAITGVVMIFRDISHRRRAEREKEAAARALRESEERLRITFASIGDAVLVTDEQGRITQLNPIGERLTGWRQSDAIGHAIQDVFVIINEESRQPAPHPVERVLREGVIAGLANHTVLISMSGDEIPIDDSAAPVQAADGRLLGAVMVFRDISQRREIERERAARARVTRELAAIVESSDDAIVSKDLDGIITAWNRAAERMYGFTAHEAVGQPIRLIVPDDLRNEEESVLQRIRRGERVDHFETRRRRKDGTTVPVSITVSPIRDETGTVIGASKIARDITARKQAEVERARLLEAERTARQDIEVAAQQLQTALRAGRMGTWEYALRTGAVKWSPGLEAIHGFAPGAFPGTFEAFRNEIHPEDRDRVLQAIAEAAEMRRDHHIEYRIVRADGAVRWVEGRGQLFLDGSQEPERMVGVCVDITERKQGEERFRLAVEAAPAAMLMVDQRGTIVLANALSEHVLGYKRDELLGQSVDRFVPAAARRQHESHRSAFFADSRPRPMGVGRDLFAVRKDGSEIPVEVGLSPIHTQEGHFVLAAVTDITARKQAETLLRTRTAELEQVLDLIPAAVWIARDPDCHEVVGNKYSAALFDVPADTNLSQTPTPGDEAPTLRHFRRDRELTPSELPMQRAAATGLPQPNEELEVELPSGKRVTMLGGAIPLTDDAGRVRGVVSAFSDISERKAIEQQRAELLAREQTARVELERASRLKDEFLAVLSHELRTPLNAILGYSSLLNMGALNPDRARHAVAAIQRNAQAQGRLIAALLDLSRVMAGKLELDVDNVDLSRVVEAAVDVVLPEANAKGVSVEIDAPPTTVTLRADAVRLEQVFWNLLTNAVKFTPRGGRIGVGIRIQDGHVQVQVTDTGRGIRAEFLPHVFDRFRQGDQSDKGSIAGLGLGLAVVRELVEAHQGRVMAHSSGEGRGSTFTVMLPLSRTPEARDSTTLKPTSSDAETTVSLDALVVDDEGDARDLLTLTLIARGAEVRAVSSAREALEQIAKRRPDVLLADLRMPDQDGFDLIRTLRAREHEQGLRRLAAIAVSAYAAPSDRDRAIAAGYDAHVAKPVDTEELVRAITRVVKVERV